MHDAEPEPLRLLIRRAEAAAGVFDAQQPAIAVAVQGNLHMSGVAVLSCIGNRLLGDPIEMQRVDGFEAVIERIV